MIIDRILDRKDNAKDYGFDEYSPHDFYFDVLVYGRIGDNITIAMDYGTEEDVKKALCDYVIDNEYNPDICNYINSVNWL